MRKVHLAVYVSETEADLLRQAAEDRGHRSFSEWARLALLQLARERQGWGRADERGE